MPLPTWLRAARARTGTRTDENSSMCEHEPKAVVSLVEGMSEKNFGAAGRNHIFESLSEAKVVWDSLACNSIGTSWQ